MKYIYMPIASNVAFLFEWMKLRFQQRSDLFCFKDLNVIYVMWALFHQRSEVMVYAKIFCL